MSLRDDLDLVAVRRDLHRFAERGWCEFRTASRIATALRDLGFDVATGRDVIADAARMGVPSAEELDRELARAIEQGADPQVAEEFRGGFTGVVGRLRADRPGPTVALRFDIDANEGVESSEEGHLPVADGFASVNEGVHHSCGHDAHVAIGLAVAQRIAQARDRLQGEVRLIFQPAEEGLRGGPAMVAAGVVGGVDHLLGCHIGVQARATGEIIAGYRNILASRKFDAVFRGRNAHAGISPHEGRNAMLAAAVAVQNLLAISRHGEGDTRVNVGTMQAGEARNAIPAMATLRGEVRADTEEALEYLRRRADSVLRGAAAMCEVDVSIEEVGGAAAASSDPGLAAAVGAVAAGLPGVHTVRETADFTGSDDMSSLMNAVQAQGGQAVYFGLGSRLADGHHTPSFDIDEAALPVGVDLMIGCLERLGAIA